MRTTRILRPGPNDQPEAAFVPLHAAAKGLGITEAKPGKYAVTHLGSGLRVWPQYGREPETLDAALNAFGVALEFGVDWTMSAEQIKAAAEYDYRDIHRRMRLAAFPPRRPRWHKGDQRRRRKPYEAQTKAEALRDAAALGDIGRSMWREFWPYHRRGAFYYTIPAVIRQPCTRFGVAHEERDVSPC